MLASDFDYALPPELIAQAPLARRDDARLLLVDRDADRLSDRRIRELPELLEPGTLLVVNDTRVIRARLKGRKPTGGRLELLLCDPLPPEGGRERWRCLGGASKPIRPGPIFLDGERAPAAEVLSVAGEYVEVAFSASDPGGLLCALDRIGEVPLPPYIRRDGGPAAVDDVARYQTLFAREPGAVAAPTAGLHFTPELCAALDARGIERATITLHVGPGTFAPLRAEEVAAQELHSERYQVSPETVRKVAAARAQGRQVVAVGTTVTRALESAAASGELAACSGETRLFIVPGFRFRVVDALLTNFHLPRSSLLMLVAALAGRERILAAYAHAVAERYRFYSYGDAMLLRGAGS